MLTINSQYLNDYNLFNIYPNPFNSITRIDYDLKYSSFIEIVIYDIAGNQKEVLFNNYQNYGSYYINWNAIEYSSGIYIVSMKQNDYIKSQKVILIK